MFAMYRVVFCTAVGINRSIANYVFARCECVCYEFVISFCCKHKMPQVLGMDVHCLGAADSKRASRKWLMKHWSDVCDHIFERNECLSSGSGRCVKHRAGPAGRYSAQCSATSTRPDISSGGFSCQAFSAARYRGGDTGNTGENHTHDKYAVAMDGIPEYLASRRPRCFWFEEVLGFCRRNVKLGGRSPLDVVCEQCAKLGYSIRAVEHDASAWVNNTRPRVFVIMCSEECGGAKGVAAVCDMIEEIFAYRRLAAPTAFDSIVDPDSDFETQRRGSTRMQASFC